MVSFEVFIEVILPAALWRGIDSASNRNEYQEYFLGVKAAGAKNLTTIMSLKFLESSWPVQACLRTALPLLVIRRLGSKIL